VKNGRRTLNEVWVRAPAQAAYQAFVEPEAIGQWLAPGPLIGKVHTFTPGAGGGFVMSLYYPSDSGDVGKTTPLEDRFRVLFDELVPGERIVETAYFESDNAVYHGATKLTVTFHPEAQGTRVALLTEDIPEGISLEDNHEGTRQSLEKLRAYLETGRV
jgi:uncharacterized protein YndB with AHSA1/START domain